ncbi:methyltransferase domain-containing protein [Stakelama sediminis]|uniref:SAM-dependent methyltransferase n=1 Tax=Stakelama sediminis TaxID=463200 RepID=A0A840YX45_9SPHN|nr:SAM-dependent methyltransferase [Stakelama sediminis]
MSVPDLFDRNLRGLRRDRAAASFAEHGFLHGLMLDSVTDRLSMVKRDFTAMLDIGCWDGRFPAPAGASVTRVDAGEQFATLAGGTQCEEDRLPFAPESFDLVVSVGVLDSVNDLPGALTLARRALKPDGLFLAAFLGAGSLPGLRTALLRGEAERPVARMHPQIDVRSAGDLLVRAGFALPVADGETISVRYGSIMGLVRDLRAMAATNLMKDRHPLSRAAWLRTGAAFAEMADTEGRTTERFEIVTLTGWAPAPSQPKPAKRGSGTTSLAEALRIPDKKD